MNDEPIHHRRIRFGRDAVLFTAGIAGVFHETVFSKADRPVLLALFAAMMGLPAFLRSDERRKHNGNNDANRKDRSE